MDQKPETSGAPFTQPAVKQGILPYIPEIAAGQSGTGGLVPDPVLPTAVDPLQAPAGGPASDVPFVDDVDDIELDKEWINKAKIIADRTKDDPFRQSSELSKVKADYLRIKYNKQIKISED